MKQRKDRAGGGEFIGFGAYASTPQQHQDTVSSVAWAPVYTGQSDSFRSFFQRIAQKRDGTTLTKALQDVQKLFQDSETPKKVQVDALQHWAWLYHTKLGPTEANATVRAASLQTWVVVVERLPKAVTNLVTKYPELLGMFLLATSDPSAEVRTLAKGSATVLFEKRQWPWQDGLLEYTHRILSYGRPSTMEENLFPKKTGGEQDREAMEERFNRLVGNSLDAIAHWIVANGTVDEDNPVWWKYLNSSKSMLRLKAYHLVSAVASKTPSLAQSLLRRMPELVSAEKDASNITSLLETVLALVVHAGSTNAPDPFLVKALSKLYRKGCHRAPVDHWGPIVLPLVVKLDQSAEVLRAVREGIDVMVTDSDKWVAWTAVCETALLCRDYATWQEGLQFSLSNTTWHRSSVTKRLSMMQNLAEQIANNESVDLTAFLDSPVVNLTELIRLLLEVKTPQRAIPELQERSLAIAEIGRDGPSLDEYELLRSCIQYVGPVALFGGEDGLIKFVNHSLKQWAITRSTESNDNNLLAQDFHVLGDCLLSSNIRYRCWEPFLTELSARKCPCATLSRGLEILVERTSSSDWIQCDKLDEYAMQIGRESVRHERDISDQPQYVDQTKFFQTCFGCREHVILRPSSLSTLVQLVQEDQTIVGSSLLESLLLACINNDDLLNFNDVGAILLAAWKCVEGPLFDKYARVILQRGTSHRRSFIKGATALLKKSLETLPMDESFETLWVARATVLLRLAEDVGERPPRLGFESMALWAEHSSTLFPILMKLLNSWRAQSKFMEFIASWFDGTECFSHAFVGFLLVVSEVGSTPFSQYGVRMGTDRSAVLLQTLGLDTQSNEFLHEVTMVVIKRIPDLIEDESELQKCVAVFLQLLAFCFRPLLLQESLSLKAESIREGDEVQYIADTSKPYKSVPAKVIKVHYDVQAGYYFTLHLLDEREDEERQTVLERLRRSDYARQLEAYAIEDELSGEELDRRRLLREEMVSTIILPYKTKISTSWSLAELVACLSCHIGLGAARGIGSLHFFVHNCIRETEKQCILLLQDGDHRNFLVSLHSLSLSLGFGRLSSKSFAAAIRTQIDPTNLTTLILDDDTFSEQKMGDEVIASWFVVCMRILDANPHIPSSSAFRAKCLCSLFGLCTNLLSTRDPMQLCYIGGTQLLYEAMMLARFLEADPNDMLEQASRRALMQFVEVYVTTDTDEESAAVYLLDSDEAHSLLSMIVESNHADILFNLFEGLCQALYNPRKRLHCLSLANLVASQKKASSKEDVRLSPQSEISLKQWLSAVEDEEEAIELEQDVYIVAEWIPSGMMSRIELWRDSSFEIDQCDLVGRFMEWLLFLAIVDTATPTEFRARPAFTSYMEKSGAINEILNLSVVYSETVGQSLLFEPDELNFETTVSVDLLATASLFRAVEVFPSLVKRWWEEDCPKASVVQVRRFVEQNVTTHILNRELQRMKKSASFGSMKVNGSTVSREIVALYEQDDFNLKVVVSVPPCFPLRSAEVDCSKTLGISPNRWKRWSLQIRLMLNNQGGTLQDAFLLWKDNVDREFEGVEPCPVCYSVLHPKTHKLPTLECTTCHNRFHTDCLMQWFRSSGKNQCVLCQQPWQGTRV